MIRCAYTIGLSSPGEKIRCGLPEWDPVHESAAMDGAHRFAPPGLCVECGQGDAENGQHDYAHPFKSPAVEPEAAK